MNVEELFARIQATPASADVRHVFGEPIAIGDRTIIPVARIGGGFGWGFGKGERAPAQGAEAATGQGGGAGGTFTARPVAVVEVTREKVRVVPIPDVTRLAVAGMLLAAWNVFWITFTVRAIRAGR